MTLDVTKAVDRSANLPANTAVPPLLIGLDIDGTIMTHDGFISEAVRGHIGDLAAMGHHVVLCTGRPVVGTLPVLADLGITEGWAVCSNGSVTVRLDPTLTEGHEVEHVVEFPAGPAVQVLREHMPGAIIGLEAIGTGYLISSEFDSAKLSGQHTVHSIEDLSTRETTRVVVAHAEPANGAFARAVKDLGLADSYYAIADVHWMDLAPSGMTKAYGMERLRVKFGVDPEHTVAVGDANNDIEMLGWAHRGVAMGHADAAVVAAANEVTFSITDDGLEPILASLRG